MTEQVSCRADMEVRASANNSNDQFHSDFGSAAYSYETCDITSTTGLRHATTIFIHGKCLCTNYIQQANVVNICS